VSKAQTKKRPEELAGKTIKSLNEEFAPVVKRNVSKVSVHSVGEGAATGTTSSVFVPNDEQLAKINSFTRREVTADDVIAFKLDAMNDLYDRDDERFLPTTVDEFAKLPQPFSFVGKSYMVDHEYKMQNARGRIFDVGVEQRDTPLGSTKMLTPSVYTPNRPQYADFIENLEFGINWAVSVGVVIDRSQCSICGAPVHTSSWSGWAWCTAGHEKGYYYVPGQEEEDGWGFYLPVDPSTKGAVKAQVDLKGAVDGYEISQVFLGAQYMAQLADKSAVRKIFAAAEKSGLPILGLSAKEAEKIKLPHEPSQVIDARSKFTVITEDGVTRWTDEKGIVWAWDSNGSTEEILCLGKAVAKDADADDDQDDDDLEPDVSAAAGDDSDDDDDQSDDDTDDDSDEDEDDSDDDDSDDDGVQAGADDQDDAVVQAQAELEAAQQRLADAQANAGKSADELAATTAASAGKGASIKSSDVLRAAKAAKLPKEIVGKLAEAEGNGLDVLLAECAKTIKSQGKEIKTLAPRAELGDNYKKEVEADALHWYTVSKRDPKNPSQGVNVEFAQKMIDRCEGDIDLIKGLAKEWRDDARAKFPQSTRRSTVHEDPNERKNMPEVPFGPSEQDSRTAKTVSRLHNTGRE